MIKFLCHIFDRFLKGFFCESSISSNLPFCERDSKHSTDIQKGTKPICTVLSCKMFFLMQDILFTVGKILYCKDHPKPPLQPASHMQYTAGKTAPLINTHGHSL